MAPTDVNTTPACSRARDELSGYNFGADGRYGTNAGHMIRLTRLNGQPIVLNPEVIESLEATPDTLISLTSGQKLVVLESVDEV